MRIVIAGSSGLIGTALVAELRQADHEVLRLVRRAPSAPDERGWDPPTGRIDDGTFNEVQAVVNLCGVGVGDRRWSGAYKQQIRDSRIEPTDVLARAVAEHGVPVLVNASAVGYYGDTGNTVVDETTPLGTGFLSEVCRDWEAATRPAGESGVRVVLLRSGLVLAPSGGLMGRLLPLFKVMLGGRLGSGEQYMPWISADDEVGAIRFLVEHEVHGPVNLVGPEPVTNTEFTQVLADVLGRRAPWTVPSFALKAVLGEFSVEILTGQRVLPTVLQERGYAFRHPTLRAALEAATGR